MALPSGYGPNGKESKSPKSSPNPVPPPTKSLPSYLESNKAFFDQFVDPGFDLVSYLADKENLSRYIPESKESRAWIGFRNFPSVLNTTINKLKTRIPGSKKPGFNPVCACVIEKGILQLLGFDCTARLKNSKEQFDSTDYESADGEQLVAEWFSVNKAEFSVVGDASPRSICVPESIKLQLSKFSSDLGMTETSTGILAMMVVLRDQEVGVHQLVREEMDQCVRKFMGRMLVRCEIARRLMDMLKKPIEYDGRESPELELLEQ